MSAGSSTATGSGAAPTGHGFAIAVVVVLLLVGSCGALIVGGGRMASEDPAALSCLPAAADGVAAPPGSVIMPLREGEYQITDHFGTRGGAHRGTDFAAGSGTPMFAVADGVVAEAGPASGFGNWVVIDHPIGDATVGTVYGHIENGQLLVRTGDRVRVGQHIANVGNAGDSSGPHLHFEVWPGGRFAAGATPVDPEAWLANAKPVPAQSDTATQASRAPPTTTQSAGDVRLVAAVSQTGAGCGAGMSGDLDTDKLLAEYPHAAPFIPWIIQAAKTCPATPAPLIAAQLRNEAGFQLGLVSPAGALGPAQFMPGTWASQGVDGDGDGQKDPNSIADAVMSQAAYNCASLADIKEKMRSGVLEGDEIELLLSYYNCGPGGTQGAGGVCQNTETQRYVKEIPETARRWTKPGTTTQPGAPQAGPFGQRAVAAATRWLGSEYVWGGGDQNGPTKGGFDCSGLMIKAIADASNGAIVLDHYTTRQLNDPRGHVIDRAQVAPGDLVFPAGDDPQHVAMYIGDGQIVEAPTFGVPVKITPIEQSVGADFQVRRFG